MNRFSFDDSTNRATCTGSEKQSLCAASRILTGIRGEYERFHGLKITDGAISAAVALSERYLPFRRFPDKAIDLLDESAGSKRMEGGKRLTAADVARTLGRMTGVPVDGALRVCDRVAHTLEAKLFGQDDARRRIAAAFETADCASPNGAPLCSLLLFADRVDAAVPFVPLTADALTAVAAAALERAGLSAEQAPALAENARSPRELLRRVRAAAARPLCLLTEAEAAER